MINDTIREISEAERCSLQNTLAVKNPVTAGHTAKWCLVWIGGLVLVILAAAGLIALNPNPIIGGILGSLLAIVV